jgi:hypothetical protein
MWKCCSAGAILLALSLAGCVRQGTASVPQTDGERRASIASLQRVNDYPFYTMTFYGNDGLEEYLKTGSAPVRWTSIATSDGFSCTSLAVRGSDSRELFGRNFDWAAHIALLIFVHPRVGYSSVAMCNVGAGLGYETDRALGDPRNEDALLRSQLFPFDGMNERGVAMSLMAVASSSPPSDPRKQTVSNFVLIRLVLDRARNVDEATRLIRGYNWDFSDMSVHYLIADAAGDSAVVEFVDRDVKVIRGERNVGFQVCTNNNLSDMEKAGLHMPHVANFPFDGTLGATVWRYAKVYESLNGKAGKITMADAMSILEQVTTAHVPSSLLGNTMWSAVYDLTSLRMDVAIDSDFSQVYHYALDKG